jgi:hypothetical protein
MRLQPEAAGSDLYERLIGFNTPLDAAGGVFLSGRSFLFWMGE